ncbi:MAG TPA: TVP38/TMEM64 family protein [Thermoanaerobaculia bacterium]|nr:TVP38/TMEM64 family protein [Thermoanaerobaculia bacterium]
MNRGKLVLYIFIGLAVATLLILGGRQLEVYLPQFRAWVEGLGALAPVVFVLGYAVATLAFIPGSALTLAAGAIFGVVEGTIYTLLGATLGASAAFLVARYVARGAIERRISGNPRFAAIDRAVGREGFKIVALLRLSPALPFTLLNYALGLTRVRFLHYLAASIAMLPGTLLYVYSGAAVGDLAEGAGNWALLGVGLVATIVVTTFVTRLAGRALRQEIE